MNQSRPRRPFAALFPGHVTVAWAILAAAGGVALMYAPPVYQGRCSGCFGGSSRIYLSRTGTFYEHGRAQVLGDVVYEREYGEPGEVEATIDQWHRRVAARFAGVGALAGALVGWREQRRARKRPPHSGGGWLGVFVGATVFSILVVGGAPGADRASPWTWWGNYLDSWLTMVGWDWFWDDVGEPIAWESLRLGLPAVAIGWAAHVAAAARGVRFLPGHRPDQAEDYADSVPAAAGG